MSIVSLIKCPIIWWIMKLFERLKSLRAEKKITRRNLAKFLGIDNSTYGKYELGTREPKIETLVKLADYFDVSADYLLGRTDVRHIAGTGSGVPGLPPEALRELESYKEYLRQKYGGKVKNMKSEE